MGIQLLQWCPATARRWIPVEEWEGHSSLQVPGRFWLVLICFLSNNKKHVLNTFTGSFYCCRWQVVVVLCTMLFCSFFSCIILHRLCSEAAVRHLNTSMPTGGSKDATLAFCSAARTPSSPWSCFLAAELITFFCCCGCWNHYHYQGSVQTYI